MFGHGSCEFLVKHLVLSLLVLPAQTSQQTSDIDRAVTIVKRDVGLVVIPLLGGVVEDGRRVNARPVKTCTSTPGGVKPLINSSVSLLMA